jgi:hypothetical protein
MRWFGPAPFAAACLDTERDIAPFAYCMHCDEPFADDDCGFILDGGPIHQECMIRMIAGSVLHQMKLCSCFGGPYTDRVEGRSKRDDARAAMRYLDKHGPPHAD